MKLPGKPVLFLVWFLAAILPRWAGATPPPPATGTITDALGRTQTLSLPVEKMVILPSDALEIVRMLGVSDRVVGVNSHIVKDSGYWPGLSKKPGVGHPFSPSYEKILALWPDLVVAYSHWPGQELEEKLTPFGIKVLRLDFFRLSEIKREVREFAGLLGGVDRAGAYTAWLDRYLTLLSQRVPKATARPRVYLEGYTDFKASGPGSGGYEMGTHAGGNLISSGFAVASPKLSTEFIAEKNPDIIVKMASGLNAYYLDGEKPLKDIRDALMDRPGWHAIKAVRTGRVFVIAAEIGPGPAEIIGVLAMAKFFYPDRFRDLDIQAVQRDYLQRFQDIPLQGCFTYP